VAAKTRREILSEAFDEAEKPDGADDKKGATESGDDEEQVSDSSASGGGEQDTKGDD